MLSESAQDPEPPARGSPRDLAIGIDAGEIGKPSHSRGPRRYRPHRPRPTWFQCLSVRRPLRFRFECPYARRQSQEIRRSFIGHLCARPLQHDALDLAILIAVGTIDVCSLYLVAADKAEGFALFMTASHLRGYGHLLSHMPSTKKEAMAYAQGRQKATSQPSNQPAHKGGN
jgi:hypothetical protein